MIRDLDATLSAWLGTLVPGVPVSFGPVGFGVDGQAVESDGSSSLWLHLYDVQEESGSSTAGWSAVRDGAGRVVGQLPPQRRYRFRYLLSAVAKQTLDEHELLGRVLAGAALHDVVPAEHLNGSLALAEAEVLVRCAPARLEAALAEPGEGWRAGRRTALELSVLAPLVLDELREVAPPPGSIQLGAGRLAPARTDRAGGPGGADGQQVDRARPTHRITEGPAR